jgi:tetratricopeptide (TPR) repeat protein
MGDILRKLGRLGESEAAYRRAITVLEPLAVPGDKGRETSRSLARARALLADLLVRRGSDAGQADRLYAQAVEAQRALVDAPRDPAGAAEDLLRLGQTEKGRSDLLRLGGRLDEATAAYDRAIAALERASAAAGAPAEARTELAWAVDARGLARRERGEAEAAEADYRRAVEMLEKIVAAFPTVPRHREALARALNSLALLEQETGRLADAEAHLLRERPLAERLAQDFPDRPEYRRILARTLTNLGAVLWAQRRLADAEPVLRRAVDVDAQIAARSRDDVQIRLDLARAHVSLGEVLRQKGEAEPAVESLRAARPVLEAMVRDFPDQPRYRDLLAQDLVDLALATQAADPGGAEKLYRDGQDLFDKLVADFPDHVDYRIGQARCLQNQGAALASAGRADRAEASYRRALALLDAGPAGADPRGMQTQAEVLNNLGNLLRRLGRPEAEAIFLRAQGIFTGLASRPKATIGDRHNLAIAHYNLGEALLGLKRLADAEAAMSRAAVDFEKLVGEAPRSVDFHSQLGLVLGRKADVLVQAGRLAEASAALAQAISHEDRAVQLGRNRADTRTLLGSLLLERAQVDLDRGAYQEAADDALRAPRAVPESGRGRAYFDAATILARLVGRVGADPKLVPADRERLIRPYLGHTLVMLREAMDIDPATAGRIRGEPAIKALESRPEFRTTVGALIDPGR